jgi:predicted house-cleaning NTP pyrophosphatase (Maf/HAM1 superfamily)
VIEALRAARPDETLELAHRLDRDTSGLLMVARKPSALRTLADVEIERYIEREQPFDCAGGFKAEALGITLFERMDSQDPTAIVGLPLIWLAGALRTAGFTVP